VREPNSESFFLKDYKIIREITLSRIDFAKKELVDVCNSKYLNMSIKNYYFLLAVATPKLSCQFKKTGKEKNENC